MGVEGAPVVRGGGAREKAKAARVLGKRAWFGEVVERVWLRKLSKQRRGRRGTAVGRVWAGHPRPRAVCSRSDGRELRR